MAQRLAPGAAAATRFRDDLAAVWPGSEEERLLVAVSGGPDSLALLLLAQAVLGERCTAATVDHGIRSEGAAEAAYVAELCRHLGVEHATLTAPLPPRVGGTANLSARARALRYTLLEDHLALVGAARIATAHHADDQLETLVMRLNRGAGVAGLAGIRARGGRLVRPVLGWRRAELAQIVAASGVRPIADPSNVNDRFDRARLRKALSGAGWLDASMWGRSAAALGDAEAALDWAARRFVEEHAGAREDGSLLLLLGDDVVPWEIARRAFLLALRRIDPAIDPKGRELSRLVGTMLHSDPPPPQSTRRRPCATLGRVRVEAHRELTGGRGYAFSPVPPPRGH